jgi:hypothetical protein
LFASRLASLLTARFTPGLELALPILCGHSLLLRRRRTKLRTKKPKSLLALPARALPIL